ncbi:hypothetical protein LIER_34834 [Lithospermum erythrorhizon]|uniref:NB-ARC domain-containing protein n=1 Tax=Lithospermum erythrorhizon TaxID=34254 RepID=A0AAV3S481_LITER
MTTTSPLRSPSFHIEDFKKRVSELGEVEKFLVDELPEEKLPKMFHIREKFNAVLDKIDKVEDESKRREDMYHLVNVLTQWKEIKVKHRLYTPERIHYEYQLKFTLNRMVEVGEHGNVPTTTNNNKPVLEAEEEEVEFPDNLLECRWSSRYLTAKKVHGLDEKIKFMERMMVKKTREDGMFGAIAIIGIPGVGKTTLCQVMLNNEKVKKHYPFQLWVCLSKQEEEVENGGSISRKVEILKRMLICLGHDDDVVEAIIKDDRDEGNIHKLIFAIRRQLKGKKYLVVLDDASEADLDFLENLSDKTSESSEDGITYKMMSDVFPRDPGGMVVVTTRMEKVAKKIVSEKDVHELPLLEHKEDCWKIFKDTVEKDERKFPEEDEDIKELITAKCASVPLAAKMMGLIMLSQIEKREKKAEAEKPQD